MKDIVELLEKRRADGLEWQKSCEKRIGEMEAQLTQAKTNLSAALTQVAQSERAIKVLSNLGAWD